MLQSQEERITTIPMAQWCLEYLPLQITEKLSEVVSMEEERRLQ